MSVTLGPLFNIQNNKVRVWSIQLSLFDANKQEAPIKGDAELIVVQPGYYASYSTISGYDGMKMIQSAETVVSTGKNLGRKNQTNALTQALKECRSKYAAKEHAGYAEQAVAMSTYPFPMAVKSWKDYKHKLVFPLHVQPKLDGIRMLALYKNNNVKLLTRRLHEISGFVEVRASLKEMFRSSKHTNLVIDGELYAHGVNLQTISSIVRNESLSEDIKSSLQYHVFDCFEVEKPELEFATRRDALIAFVQSAKTDKIVLTPTILAADSRVADDFYKKQIADGYEGVIYKSRGKPYAFDFNKEKRSMWYLKRKKQEDSEFIIVGFTEGKGKDIGCIVFILETPNHKQFNCVPNGTYAYRREMYDQAKTDFDVTFKGRLAKVTYDDLSIDHVPLRGRIVQIGRDLSFD